MEKALFKVDKSICDDCVLALRRFIGHMEGVESIDVDEEGKITLVFDKSKISGGELSRITKDSIEKLGYKLIEWKGL